MPKKPAPNGYYFFMLDFKRREESFGRRFPGGMPEVSEAASDDWKALPQADRERYNKLAKERKNDPRPNVPKADEKRFNSQGISFAALKRQKEKAEKKLQEENSFISQFVSKMTVDDLHHKLIYLIHVNIFCKTDADVYYPAEIGIVKFTLEDGVKDIFHRFIDPGEIATGYSYAVKEHSDLTHKLTLSHVRSVAGSSDLHQLYKDICTFLTEDEDERDEGNIPPMFTMYDDLIHNTSLTAARKTLKNLWEMMYPSHDGDEDYWERFFKILPLPDMFHKLKNKCQAIQDPNLTAFPNAVLAKNEFLKDTYNYDSKTACQFHREADIIIHCSQSFVLRWAFIIRDHCTLLIDVDMFKENTVPKPARFNRRQYDNDDTRSVTESLRSVQISEASEASIGFPKASACRKRVVGNSSQTSSVRRDNENGSAQRDRNSASTSHSYASVSNAIGWKDAGESRFGNSTEEDDDLDAISSVSAQKERKQMSRVRRDDENGSAQRDRNSASTSHSYASVSNAIGWKNAEVSRFRNSAEQDDDLDAISSVSSPRRRDTDQESDKHQSIKSCPVAWPCVNRRPQPQNVLPVMNENNFPSLGRGRGRGSLRSLSGN